MKIKILFITCALFLTSAISAVAPTQKDLDNAKSLYEQKEFQASCDAYNKIWQHYIPGNLTSEKVVEHVPRADWRLFFDALNGMLEADNQLRQAGMDMDTYMSFTKVLMDLDPTYPKAVFLKGMSLFHTPNGRTQEEIDSIRARYKSSGLIEKDSDVDYDPINKITTYRLNIYQGGCCGSCEEGKPSECDSECEKKNDGEEGLVEKGVDFCRSSCNSIYRKARNNRPYFHTQYEKDEYSRHLEDLLRDCRKCCDNGIEYCYCIHEMVKLMRAYPDAG